MPKLSRRDLLFATTGMVALPALASSSNAKHKIERQHICLVHGAWHGAWAWVRLIPLLVDEGYAVSALDLSGLGANSHRQAPDIGLHVHGQDVLNHLYFNDIRDAVVVAHSYAGAVLSEAVAADSDGRITHAIYLDAFLLGKGESVVSFLSPDDRETFEIAAEDGAMIPPRPQETWEEMWGLTGADAEWSSHRMRPMSARCFTEAVRGDPFTTSIRRTYMLCVQNKNVLFRKFSEKAQSDQRFAQIDVEGHHNVMVIDPLQMKESLLSVL